MTAAVLVLIAIIVFVVFSGQFSLTKIEVVRDNLNVNAANIHNELNQYLKNNLLFLDRSEIIHYIQENYPEFEVVRVKKLLPHTLKVELNTYEIVANIKAYYQLPEVEPDPLKSLGSDYESISDALEEAFTLDEAPEPDKANIIEQKALLNRVGQAIFDQDENLELMTLYIEGLTQPIQDREVVVEKEKLDIILDTVKYFNNTLQIPVEGIRYLPVAREVHLFTENGMVVWVSMERDYREQIDKLNTIYKVAELDKEDIDYIDLRISEKLIYCPRNTACSR